MTTRDTPALSIPALLYQSTRSLKQKREGLKPAWVEAHGHLIDLAELFLTLHAATACTGLRQLGLPVRPEYAGRVDSFLNTKLNAGHWLELWKQSSAEFSNLTKESPNAAKSVSELLRKHIQDIDTLPNLRNRHRGHTFAPSADEAKQTIERNEPTLSRLLNAASGWFSRWALMWCRDVDGACAELCDLTNVASLSEASEVSVVETTAPMVRDGVYLVSREALTSREAGGMSALGSDDTLALAPFVVVHQGTLAVFQGIASGEQAKYLSISTWRSQDNTINREFSLPMESVKTALTSLLPPHTALRSRVGRRPPHWASQLEHHDLLCDAELAKKAPSATEFFRGNAPTWADLRECVDIRRNLRDRQGLEVSAAALDERLPELLRRAKHNEAPLVLFTGPAGSGKTTHLLRVGFEIWTHFDETVRVLRHHAGLGLSPDLRELELVHRNEPDRTIVVLYDEAGPIARQLDGLRRNLQHKRIPALLLCAERPNLWPEVPADSYELHPQLGDSEAKELLDRLETHGLLGCLSDLSPDARRARLRDTWDGEILVSLREATEGKRFDEIIESEYRVIPTRAGKDVYLTTALVHRCGLPLPQEVAYRVAGVPHARAFREVRQACKGAVVAHGDAWVRTRHRRIAEVLCPLVQPDYAAQLEDLAFALGAAGPNRLEWVAQVLAAPETEPLLLLPELGRLPMELRGIGSQLGHDVIWRALELTSWRAPGVIRIAAALVGEDIEFLRLDHRALGKLFRAITETMGPEVAVAMARNALAKSEITDKRSDEMAAHAMIALDGLGQQADGLHLMRSEIARCHALGRDPMELYVRLGDFLRVRGLLEEAEATALTGLSFLKRPSRNAANLYACLVDTRIRMGRLRYALEAALEGLEVTRRWGDDLGATHQMWIRIVQIKLRQGEAAAAVKMGLQGIEELRIRGENGDESLASATAKAAVAAEQAGELTDAMRERLLDDVNVPLVFHARLAQALAQNGRADLAMGIVERAWNTALDTRNAAAQHIAIARADLLGAGDTAAQLVDLRVPLVLRNLPVDVLDGTMAKLTAAATASEEIAEAEPSEEP